MKHSSSPALLLVLGFVSLFVSGCVALDELERPSARGQATLLTLVDDSGQLTPGQWGERRHEIITYLINEGYIYSGEDLVQNPAFADQIIRANLALDGSFELTIYRPERITQREIIFDPIGDPFYLYHPGQLGYFGDGFAPCHIPLKPYFPRHAVHPHRRNHRRDNPEPPGHRPTPGQNSPGHRDAPSSTHPNQRGDHGGRPPGGEHQPGGRHPRKPLPQHPDTPGQPPVTAQPTQPIQPMQTAPRQFREGPRPAIPPQHPSQVTPGAPTPQPPQAPQYIPPGETTHRNHRPSGQRPPEIMPPTNRPSPPAGAPPAATRTIPPARTPPAPRPTPEPSQDNSPKNDPPPQSPPAQTETQNKSDPAPEYRRPDRITR